MNADFMNANFTPQTEKIISMALTEAGGERIRPEHLLLAIVSHGDNLAVQALLYNAAPGWGADQCLAALRKKLAALKKQKDSGGWWAGEAEPTTTGSFDIAELLPTIGRLGAVVLEDLAKWVRRAGR